MKADKILFIDTETGGIDPSNNSLLSIGLAIWQNFDIVDSKEILINDGVLNVTVEALKINGIDIEKHKLEALPAEQAIDEFNTFLSEHFSNEKITLGGHNINFDVNFLKHFLFSYNYNFHKRFSHRYVDTSTILYYLYLSGKIKQKAISSQEAFDFFCIKVQDRHTALSDVLATAKLFSKLLRIIYKPVRLQSKGTKDLPTLFE